MCPRLALLALCLLICSGPLAAQEALPEAPMRGAGASTCAKFADYMRHDSSAEDNFYSWAQGFMSGLNQVIFSMDKLTTGEGRKGLRNLMATTNHQQKAKLRMYCDRYPLRTYMMGVLELYDGLPSMSPRKE
jgi:hypothetical protein